MTPKQEDRPAERSTLGAAHEYPLLIQEQHLDTFGHVNNAAYLQILEQARWDMITRNGYGLREVLERRIGPTVLEVHLRFVREIRNRQNVTIRSWLVSYAGKAGRLAQHIVDEAGNVCCEAAFTIGLFDMTTRRLIRPTPEWAAALGLDLSQLEAAPSANGRTREAP